MDFKKYWIDYDISGAFIFNYIKNLINNPKIIEIYHEFELPVECGYGASGSGALGAIFGLNKLLGLKLSYLECELIPFPCITYLKRKYSNSG